MRKWGVGRRLNWRGGQINSVAADPVLSGTYYAATASNGVFRSIDFGASWKPLDQCPLQFLGDLRVGSNGWLYAVSGLSSKLEVVRSKDGGASWETVNSGLDGLFSGEKLAIDPQFPSKLWIAADNSPYNSSYHNLYSSIDGGDSWADRTGPWPFYGSILDIEVDPKNTEAIHVLVSSGVTPQLWKTDNGGDSWSYINHISFGRDFAVDPLDSARIFVAATGALHRSLDGGNSFSILRYEPFQSVELFERDGESFVMACALVWNEPGPHFFLSRDDGETFELADWGIEPYTCYDLDMTHGGGDDLIAATDAGPIVSRDFGATWTLERNGLNGFGAQLLVADPLDPATLYSPGAGGRGLVKTTDGGNTWQYHAAEIYPFSAKLAADRSTLYGHSPSIGEAYRSDDAGVSWMKSMDPSEQSDFYPTGTWLTSVAAHPENPDTVFAGQYSLAIYNDTATALLYRSTDRGVFWDPLYRPDEGFMDYYREVPQIEIDPSDPSRIYIATWNYHKRNTEPDHFAILRSTDGGPTMEEVLRVDDLPSPRGTIAVHPLSSDLVYVFFPPLKLLAPSYFFRSQDGGDSWEELTPEIPCDNGLRSFALDPFDLDTFLLSCEDVYISRDAGESWLVIDKPTYPEVYATYDLAVSETYPQVLWAGTSAGIHSYTFPPLLEVNGSCPGSLTISIKSTTPEADIWVIRGEGRGNETLPGPVCSGTPIEMGEPSPFVRLAADERGEVAIAVPVGDDLCRRSLQAVDVSSCATSFPVRIEPSQSP